MNSNQYQIRNLCYLKNKIMSINDVYDFCQREGKLINLILHRVILSKATKLYSRFFLPILVQSKKSKNLINIIKANDIRAKL